MSNTPPVESSRIRAIKAELDKCAVEYRAAKDQFEKARVEFEIAREKLTGVKQLAANMLTDSEYRNWGWNHLDVVHAGVPIGDAISYALWNHAWDNAVECYKNIEECPYAPDLSLDRISDDLEKGGFDFRTSTPLREINGALLQLKGVEKLSNGNYKRVDSYEIYKSVEEAHSSEN